MMVDHQRRLIVKSSGVCLLWLVIIVCGNQGSEIRALDGGGGGSGGGNHHPHIHSLGNVTVLAGQRGELKCQVTNLANYSVMWIRHRDTHLLTIGTDGYIPDTRFRAFYTQGSIWGLRISSTRISDGGVYECQMSTTPPISAFTHLTVVEPVTRIEGVNARNSELFIKAGSTINLTCIVEDATDNAPKHILWRHNQRTVNFEWSRGGMSLVTEKKMKGVTVSRLLIQKAVRSDSGVYMCAPQNAHPAYARIQVLEQGEKQAAMQSGTSLPSSLLCTHHSIIRYLLVAVIVFLLDNRVSPFILVTVEAAASLCTFLLNDFPQCPEKEEGTEDNDALEDKEELANHHDIPSPVLKSTGL